MKFNWAKKNEQLYQKNKQIKKFFNKIQSK